MNRSEPAQSYIKHWRITKIALLAGIILGGGTGCNSPQTSITAPSSPQPEALNSGAVRLATSALIQDVMLGASEVGKSTLTREQALAIAKLDLAVNTSTFDSDYEANELAADAKYKGHHFLLSGKIAGIEKDFTGDGYLVLRSPNPLGVHAELSDRGILGAASLSKGTTIFLVCDRSDRVMGIESAGDCQRLSQYLEQIRPEMEAATRDFLEGKIALPKALGAGVTLTYVAGSHLPPESPCFTGLDEACEQDIGVLFKDKSRSEALKTEAGRMESHLLLK